jgi:LmbE family N-acetylglucosaminyl deacetylase
MTDLLDTPGPSATPSATTSATPSATTSDAPNRARAASSPSSNTIRSTAATGSRLVDEYLSSGRDLELLTAPIGRTVVVAPHPDDEALAAGGLISHQRARGRAVVVVAVTDGDAAYPDWNGIALARVRRREQLEALDVLGVGRHAVHRLGVPDGTAARHVDEIATQLRDILTPGDTLVAPATFDWHPDHEACGRAATAVADETGCSLFGSLFWAHHHPDHLPAALSLGVLALNDDAVARRRAAVDAHRSQLERSQLTTSEPILAADVLALLDRPVEYYVLRRSATPDEGGLT